MFGEGRFYCRRGENGRERVGLVRSREGMVWFIVEGVGVVFFFFRSGRGLVGILVVLLVFRFDFRFFFGRLFFALLF